MFVCSSPASPGRQNYKNSLSALVRQVSASSAGRLVRLVPLMAAALVGSLGLLSALIGVASAEPPALALRCGISTTWELFGGCPRCVRAALETGNFSLWTNRGTRPRLDDHLLSHQEHHVATTTFVPTLFGAGALTGEVTAPDFWRKRRSSKRVEPSENSTALTWLAAEPDFLRHAQAVLGWQRPDLFGPLCHGAATTGCSQGAFGLPRAAGDEPLFDPRAHDDSGEPRAAACAPRGCADSHPRPGSRRACVPCHAVCLLTPRVPP